MERHVVGRAPQDTAAKVSAANEVKDTPSDQKKNDPYAHMFAEWDLVPPQVVIRRIRRKLQ